MSSLKGSLKRRRKDNGEQWEDERVEDISVDVVAEESKPEVKQILFGNKISRKESESEFQDLRKAARRKYLSKREEQQILLAQKDLEEFERDIDRIGWDNLTEKEQKEYEVKKKVVEIYKQRKEIEQGQGFFIQSDDLNEEGHIDSGKKRDALYSKESQAVERKVDETRGRTAFTHLKEEAPKDRYQYVFDKSQQIEFDEDQVPELSPEQRELEERIKQEEDRVRTIDETRKRLPVYQYRSGLLEAIAKYPVLIVVGETGSGKTTQLPQYLFEAKYSKGKKAIGCTQPRRVAAMSVAARVADEVGTKIGNKVGYSVRFDDKTSESTAIKYMTDGMLLREFMSDPELGGYSAMMVDEAHERTLHTDILLGLLKQISKQRPDFRLIISSATMDADKFSDYFDNAPIFNIPGRRFPVDIHYTMQPEANYLHAATTTVFQIHLSQGPGDILVFLTGQDEIETMASNLVETCDKLGDQCPSMLVCPIYGNLPADRQKLIFDPTPKGSRKVVLATNIAETSLTINGISYVIDSGFVKEDRYSAATGIQKLEVVACSRASADQRAGRAGRTGAGKCFRLYTKWSFYEEMPESPVPEILRANLAGVVLQMLSLGITDLIHFDFLDAPSPESLMKALEELYALGALNEKGELTRTGRKMADLPCDPMLARSLVASGELDCCPEVTTVVAMLAETSSLFVHEKGSESSIKQFETQGNAKLGGDHLTLFQVWKEFVESGYSPQWCRDHFVQYRSLMRAKSARTQLERLCARLGMDTEHEEIENDRIRVRVMKAIASGFFANAAKLGRSGDGYKLMRNGQSVWIHPSSSLFSQKPPPKYVIYNELVMTSKEFMRGVMPVSEKWLENVGHHYYESTTNTVHS